MSTATRAQGSWTIPPVISTTNLGAMLSPVSLPNDCLNDVWNFQTGGLADGEFYTYFTQGCAISSCCPSSTPYYYPYEWLVSYYSPAVCPRSWRSCSGPPSGHVPSATGETVAFCCPRYVGVHHASCKRWAYPFFPSLTPKGICLSRCPNCNKNVATVVGVPKNYVNTDEGLGRHRHRRPGHDWHT